MKKGEKFKRVKISKQDYNKLKNAEAEIGSKKVYRRIQAFKLIHKGWKYSAIAEFLNVTKETISDWIRLYGQEKIKGLTTLHYRGGQPRLNEQQIKELKEKAAQGSFTFAKDVQHYIEKNFGIRYNLKHVQLLSKKSFVYPLRKQEKFLETHQVQRSKKKLLES